ncbi:MAG: hypothetical protein P9M11_06620 [Candidatus Tenebribacter burtonii]|jgi:hypothetical protein|nr:hypothetical protein [Candidatus Tenebribacter burtonii]
MKPEENEKCKTYLNEPLKRTFWCISVCKNYDKWEPKLNSKDKNDSKS